jgi:hypothetical protein
VTSFLQLFKLSGWSPFRPEWTVRQWINGFGIAPGSGALVREPRTTQESAMPNTPPAAADVAATTFGTSIPTMSCGSAAAEV